MTSDKLKRFRQRLVRELHFLLPGHDDVGSIANHLERFMVQEAFRLTDIEHSPDCACWDCLGKVAADVMRHQSEMKVAREMADDHD